MNLGAKKLLEWKKKNGMTQAQICELVPALKDAKKHLTQASLSDWMTGVQIPSPTYRIAIQQITGINPNDWDQEGEVEAIKRFLEAQ